MKLQSSGSIKALLVTIGIGVSPVLAGATGIRLAGEISDLSDRLALAIDVEGDNAYVAMRDTTVHILDVSEPENPTLRGIYRCRGMLSNIIGLRAHGNRLYITGRYFKIVDCSEPENPRELSSYYLNGGVGYKPAITDTFAAIPATDGTEYFFLNIIDPVHPALVYRHSGSYASRAAAMNDQFLYLAFTSWNDPGLKVYSRQSLRYSSAYLHLPTSFDIVLAGDRLYMLSGDGLRTIDVEEPYRPAVTSTVVIPGAFALDNTDTFANVVTSFGELLTIDITSDDTSIISGKCDLPSMGLDVACSNSYSYVVDNWYGTRIMRIADDGSPRNVGKYDLPERYQAAAVRDRVLFTAIRSGIKAFDVSDHDSIESIGYIETPGDARSIVLDDALAWVSLGDSGFCSVNIDDVERMRISRSYNSLGFVNAIEVKDSLLLVAAGEPGLIIYAIDNEGGATELSRTPTTGSVLDLCSRGNFVYTAEGDSGISIINVANPREPEILSRLNTPGTAIDVASYRERLYVAGGDDYVRVIDVSNPRSPDIIDEIYVYGRTMEVLVSGDYLYSATTYNVRVFWLGGLRPYYQVGKAGLPLFLPASIAGLPVSMAIEDNFIYCMNWGRFFVFDCAEGLKVSPNLELPIPTEFSLSAFPNPFNSSVTISFSTGSAARPTRLAIYDLSGRMVEDLTHSRTGDFSRRPQENKILWDASNQPAGIYFVKLQQEKLSSTQKIVLVK